MWFVACFLLRIRWISLLERFLLMLSFCSHFTLQYNETDVACWSEWQLFPSLLLCFFETGSYVSVSHRQARREGGRGEVSPGPVTFGGPAVAQKYWKWCSRWLLSDLKYASYPFLAGAPPPTPLGELTALPRTPSRMVRGHFSPRFLPLNAFGVSISRHTEWRRGW